MRRIRRGEVMVAPEIPLDLVIEIVKRLPIKSLARFKCVSKLWSSLICSQGSFFASPPRLYISSSSVVKNNYVKYELLSFCLTPTGKSSTVFDLDLTKQGIGGFKMMALRGLILYTVCGQVFIYNPTTGQKVTLPAIELNLLAEEEKEMVKQDVYFLGYDPILDQYKVLCIVVGGSEKLKKRFEQHWVFVLEAKSSWRRIEFHYPHFPSRRVLCVNGVIYYFCVSLEFQYNFMSFDVRSEEFSMIQLPHSVSENRRRVGLIDYGGKPTLFDYINLKDSLVNLWVLEDAARWSRKSLVLQPCQMHFFPSSNCFEVIGTTQNGEVVLKSLVIYYPYYVLFYDLHKNDVRRIDIRGIPKDPVHPVQSAVMDTGESIVHLKI